MKTLYFRQELDAFLDKVPDSSMVVTQTEDRGSVLLSKSEYDSWEETLYLLKSPRNVERLLRSIVQLE